MISSMNIELANKVLNSNLDSDDKIALLESILDDKVTFPEAFRTLSQSGEISGNKVHLPAVLIHAGHAVNKYHWDHSGSASDGSLRLKLDDWRYVMRDGKHVD